MIGMGVSKVEYGGRTLIDLTADSVTSDTLLKGATAHNRAGEKITGAKEFKTQSKTATPTLSAQTFTPDNGYDGLSQVIIEAIPNTYIDKSKVTHFATGTVSNVTAGQKMTVSGIKDSKTGEAFTVKGLVAFVEPSSTQNYTVSGTGKPAVCMFYRNSEITSGVAIAAYNAALTVRANTDFKNNEYIVISGNSFYFIQQTSSMWGLQAATKWRWIAWG